MENIIQYKNYKPEINFSSEDDVFYGKLIGINDLVNFEADSEKDLQKVFEEAVEEYLETLKILN
jgi:predicted HicB family RNase H-like nuclease